MGGCASPSPLHQAQFSLEGLPLPRTRLSSFGAPAPAAHSSRCGDPDGDPQRRPTRPATESPRGGAGRERLWRRQRWLSGGRARPAGRQGEAGGAGQPRLSPEEPPGGHIAELSAVAAAPLLSSGPALLLSPLPRSRDARRRRTAPQPHSGREDPLAVGVSRRRSPFPHSLSRLYRRR